MPHSAWTRPRSSISTITALVNLKANKQGMMLKPALLVKSITKYVLGSQLIAASNVFSGQALLSVFKGRLSDNKERDTAVERCEVHVLDEVDNAECRLVVKMTCRHGT